MLDESLDFPGMVEPFTGTFIGEGMDAETARRLRNEKLRPKKACNNVSCPDPKNCTGQCTKNIVGHASASTKLRAIEVENRRCIRAMHQDSRKRFGRKTERRYGYRAAA